jgi:protoporphyrinogen oxidase
MPRIVIVGGGYTGLAAAYELASRGLCPTLVEADGEVGGLAGSFPVGGARLERFYHHWFTGDRDLMDLVAELGLTSSLIRRPAQTGMYYANAFYRLASPLDLLRFSPLSWWGRLRLGLLVPAARAVRRWEDLDDRSAADWLRSVCGAEVYRVVWEPLLRGKFGPHAETISAAWFWSKLKLRGGSRGRGGREELAYFTGGFAALADAVVQRIEALGGRVVKGQRVRALDVRDGRIRGVVLDGETIAAEGCILAVPLPDAADLMADHVPDTYQAGLRAIRYLANRCLVLELDRPLGDLYWVNVNDPSFPFVGVIEHTNFADAAAYGGRHIVYLSRYCAAEDPFLALSDEEALAFALPHLQRMFPGLEPGMIAASHSWQAAYAQPLVEKGYARRIPAHTTPIAGILLATMAQVYPQDRGTNHAVRDGRKVARLLLRELGCGP